LIKADQASEAFKQAVPRDVQVFAVREWKVLGTPMPRPNRHDLVTGAHHYPSDIILPGMLYGKILRPPAYGAKLASIDLARAHKHKEAVVVRDQSFVGVAAPTTWQARQALVELEKAAQWETPPHPPSNGICNYLRQNAQGGIPANPHSDVMASAAKSLKAKYDIAYVQHAPMEPRTATAHWVEGKLTVWTATQRPFDVRRELANAFRVAEERVQVIIPDFGGGFGGKHTGECAIEAARLAQAAGKPVALHWTREEEFTWAAFRPAAAIDIEASLDDQGRITSWHFININSGQSSIQSPYNIESKNSQYVESAPPLRHGSYRALAATANTFARECFMDELAHAAAVDPLEFRTRHLDAGSRLRDALEDAATRFKWAERRAALANVDRGERRGVGLACGTEKGSFVAACAEVAVDLAQKSIRVLHITQTFDCGAITSPRNLLSQVQGAIVMGLGPALSEEMIFKDGKMLNAAFKSYAVPRMKDLPEMDVHLFDRPDVQSAGAGETPLIAVAPAIGNAIFHATGTRLRAMPMRLARQSEG
jgi:isoquinoline 1-oxidoreductase